MILNIFCVRDRATDQFGSPMFLVSTGQAIRSFTDEVNRDAKDNQIFNHPDDFDLFRLGTWDTDTAVFVTRQPEQVCVGKDVKIRGNGHGG